MSSHRIRPRRRFSLDFKRARVRDFESGTFSVSQMSRLYDIKGTVLYRWIKKFGQQATTPQAVIVEVPHSQTEKVKRLEARLAMLERLVGNKQIEIEFHKERLQLLAEEHGINVQKKVTSTPPSSDSANDKTPS
ncbi:transposase [Lewinella sp. IMCC34191]|uniref:transposase n=1 Tax=Lewinella sp. IMCC34191 TaxID=2259172 RepID=UPI000E260255